jgi:DDE_Tnp_1-associated
MLLDYLKEIPDHRRRQGQRYDLAGVLMAVVLAVLSDAYSYRRIHTFIATHFTALKQQLGLSWKRTPSYTGVRDIIQGVSALELEAAFRKYSAAVAMGMAERCAYLACDGKVLRGSFDHMEDRKAAQLLSVFATDSQLILAHAEIPDKTNEIPTFQALVKELGLSGKLFALDAMHAQKNTCRREGQRQRRGNTGQRKPKATAG